MTKAKAAKIKAQATTAHMVKDGITYHHAPETIGHAKHDASCWIPDVAYVEVSRVSEYGLTQTLPFAVRVF